VKTKISKWIVLPHNMFNIVFDSVVSVFYLMSLVLTPLILSSSFRLCDLKTRIIDFLIDIVLTADILVNFFTAYEVDGELITNQSQIMKNYFGSFFIIDVLGTLPSLLTAELFSEVYYFKILRYWRVRMIFVHLRFVISKLEDTSFRMSKKTISDVIKLTECLSALVLLIHVCGCIWIFMGSRYEEGWINQSNEFQNFESDFFTAYSASLYFITKTFTWVGYGNLTPRMNIEMVYVMFLEMVGIAFYSFIVGTLFSIRFQKSYFKILEEKGSKIEAFLLNLNQSWDLVLPNEVINLIRNNLEVALKYDFHSLFTSTAYFSQLKPQIQIYLTKRLLMGTYSNFYNFFSCEVLAFSPSDKFIVHFLSSLEHSVNMPDKVVVDRGEHVNKIYFIQTGSVVVKDTLDGEELALIPRYSYFGDYQVILDACSNVCFVTSQHSKAVFYTIKKDVFLTLLDNYKEYQNFFKQRAMANRNLFNKLRKDRHSKLLRKFQKSLTQVMTNNHLLQMKTASSNKQ
jgi:hypothetical protein